MQLQYTQQEAKALRDCLASLISWAEEKFAIYGECKLTEPGLERLRYELQKADTMRDN